MDVEEEDVEEEDVQEEDVEELAETPVQNVGAVDVHADARGAASSSRGGASGSSLRGIWFPDDFHYGESYQLYYARPSSRKAPTPRG